jgi:hypothetical protein
VQPCSIEQRYLSNEKEENAVATRLYPIAIAYTNTMVEISKREKKRKKNGNIFY